MSRVRQQSTESRTNKNQKLVCPRSKESISITFSELQIAPSSYFSRSLFPRYYSLFDSFGTSVRTAGLPPHCNHYTFLYIQALAVKGVLVSTRKAYTRRQQVGFESSRICFRRTEAKTHHTCFCSPLCPCSNLPPCRRPNSYAGAGKPAGRPLVPRKIMRSFPRPPRVSETFP